MLTYKIINLIDDICIMQSKACWSQSIVVFHRFLLLFTVYSQIDARNSRSLSQPTKVVHNKNHAAL